MTTELTAGSATTTGTETTTIPASGLAERLRRWHIPIGHGRTAWRRIRQSGILLALVLLIVLASVLSPYFFQPGNLLNVARQVSIIGIIAVGMTFVILTGGIDLSVGSILGLVAVVAAQQLQNGVAPLLVVGLALVLGTALGAVNGLGITLGGVPPFIMTLGMLVMARGAALTYAEGQPVSLGDAKETFSWLGRGDIGGIPVPVFIFAIVAIAGMVVLRFTTFGRYIYAIGSNREAARLAGIKVRAYTTLVYVISGFLAGLTALIWVSRLTVGEPTAGTGTRARGDRRRRHRRHQPLRRRGRHRRHGHRRHHRRRPRQRAQSPRRLAVLPSRS